MLNDTAAATVAGFVSSFMAARAASDCAAMASRRKASGLTARASYARIFVVSLHAKVWAAISCDVTGANRRRQQQQQQRREHRLRGGAAHVCGVEGTRRTLTGSEFRLRLCLTRFRLRMPNFRGERGLPSR